ncbi:hypothetical protein P167DRAFT_210852 [Morchella conica CCBAS932]|uniref:Uncharacterized protein n=1 Tax=Morchella conica CCBAS932 TaxID=1392247 RepID=A0A3N4L0Z5_9PEZI|nr:hypothetical protein P167DRAFT_210852 [Morchella conica CCBAS932]
MGVGRLLTAVAITLTLPTLWAIQNPIIPPSTLTEHQSRLLTALSPNQRFHKHNRTFPQTYVQVPCIHHLHLASKSARRHFTITASPNQPSSIL